MAAAVPHQAVPARVRLYVACVAAAAVASLPLSLLAGGSRGGVATAFEAGLLVVLIAAAHRNPVHVGPKRKLNVATAPEVAAVLLLAGPIAVLTLTAGTVAGQAQSRGPLSQHVFNAALAALRASAGSLTYAAVLRLGPETAARPVATLAAPAVMFAVTTLLVRGVAAVQIGRDPPHRPRLPERDVVVAESTLSLTGVMAALAAATNPWALPLLIAPAVIVQRAVRDSLALQAQQRLTEDALRAAEAALAVREDFLTVAVHEIRTPLTSLKTYLQLARRRLRRGSGLQETDRLMEQADAQVDRLSGRVHELLDLSRISADGLVIERATVMLGPLVQRAVEIERAAADPPREISLTMPESPPEIAADANRLEQVLINLLDNACKYSPPTKPIHTRVRVEPDTVAIAVEDQGIGIPPEDQPHIFERFHRAGNIDRGITGFGIGLYIAQQIVTAHGGRLTVSSAPGYGSTFEIILPRNASALH